jgi:hypothetical protein
VGADKKLVAWDMQTGMIVARQTGIKDTACACWGGRRLDTKRRPTTDYQLATGGVANLTYWTLNPMEGSFTREDCTLGNQVRNFTAIAFSFDEDYFFAGSSSSDFTAVHVKHKVLHSTTGCGSGGVLSIVAMRTANSGDRVIVGCGDGSISVFEGQRNGAQTCGRRADSGLARPRPPRGVSGATTASSRSSASAPCTCAARRRGWR